MNRLWQVWYGGISAEIPHIINAGENSVLIDSGRIGFDGETQNLDVRKSEIKWINPESQDGQQIKNLLMYFVRKANKNAFGFILDDELDMQYTKYDSSYEGKYDWHIDTFWANSTCYDRKLSVVVQLSDSSEYEGGDFQFDPQYEQPDNILLRKKGTVIVFPSFIMHRVTPVTSGTRKSLVSWIQGPKFR